MKGGDGPPQRGRASSTQAVQGSNRTEPRRELEHALCPAVWVAGRSPPALGAPGWCSSASRRGRNPRIGPLAPRPPRSHAADHGTSGLHSSRSQHLAQSLPTTHTMRLSLSGEPQGHPCERTCPGWPRSPRPHAAPGTGRQADASGQQILQNPLPALPTDTGCHSPRSEKPPLLSSPPNFLRLTQPGRGAAACCAVGKLSPLEMN